LTLRSKGRRSRSHCYENRHGRTVASDQAGIPHPYRLRRCCATCNRCQVDPRVDSTAYVLYSPIRPSLRSQRSNYRKTGRIPHCDRTSSPLFVFLASQRGTVFVNGTTGARVSLTSSSTSMSHVTHWMLRNLSAIA